MTPNIKGTNSSIFSRCCSRTILENNVLTSGLVKEHQVHVLHSSSPLLANYLKHWFCSCCTGKNNTGGHGLEASYKLLDSTCALTNTYM